MSNHNPKQMALILPKHSIYRTVIYNLKAGLEAVVTRHSWYQVGQEQLKCGALVTKLVTNGYDSRTIGSN